MKTSYIYSVSRTNTLAQYLLTKTDIERLLVAEAGSDLQSALKETYLAPYLLHVPSGEMSDAIEQTLIDAKKLVHRIAPKGNMFRVLWVQYDIHNLRVFVKGAVKNLSLETLLPYVSERGIYTPTELYTHAQNGTLSALQSGWQEKYTEAFRLAEQGELDQVDAVLDSLYFATCKRIAHEYGDVFIKEYVSAMIDTYNLKSRLRTIKYPQLVTIPYVAGGTISGDELTTNEQVFTALQRLGGLEFWQEALDFYLKTGNSTRIDARADEYLLTVAKRASADMFSSASLVLYYLQCRQAAANVRTIVVGKNSGMNEENIRANLRMKYVND